MKKIGNGLLFCILLFSFNALAKVNVEATVDRSQVNAGDAMVLTISVSSDQSLNVAEPRLPTLNGFQLVDKWSGTEARSTFSNGQFQTLRTRKFNYRLTAPRQGSFTIGGAEVVVNGQSFRTKPVRVQVVAGGAPPARRKADPFGNDPMNEMDDLFNQLLGRTQQPANGGAAKASGDLVSIKVNVDKKEIYVGEQVTASWHLYTTGQVRDIDTLKYPSLNGFWKEDLHIATHLNFRREVVNGVIHKKALLASYALFPIKPGDIQIDPYIAKLTAYPGNRGFGFGFNRPQTAEKRSRTIPVKVKPLPPGAPEDFVGAVGEFDMTAKLDTNTAVVNQPFTLKVRFDGRGNAKLIELPNVDWPEQVELYDTKKESKFFKNGKSYKEFELLVIPRAPGVVQIPALSASYFDPKAEKYVTRTTETLTLSIQPGKADEMIPSQPVLAQTAPEKKKEALPRESLVWASSGRIFFFDRITTWAVAFLMMAGLLLVKARREFDWGAKGFGVSQAVRKRFHKARDLAEKGEWREVGVETTNAVYLALGAAAGEGGASVEIEKLLLKAPPSIRRDFGDEIRRLMEVFQILSFAPEGVVGPLKEKANLQKSVREMESIILKALSQSLHEEEGEELATN